MAYTSRQRIKSTHSLFLLLLLMVIDLVNTSNSPPRSRELVELQAPTALFLFNLSFAQVGSEMQSHSFEGKAGESWFHLHVLGEL
jgi:hypothetical protein